MFFFMVLICLTFDSLEVFLNCLYLIVSDNGRAKTNLLPLPVIKSISLMSELIDDYYGRTDYCNQG